MVQERAPKSSKKTCLLVGCGGAILLVIAVVALAYLALSLFNSFIESNTETEPAEVPALNVPEDRVQETVARIKDFAESVKQGKATEPLALTGEDVTVWCHNDPVMTALGADVYVEIVDDMVRAEWSLPLTVFEKFNSTAKGKYFNGKAAFGAAFKNGVWSVKCTSLEYGKTVVDHPQAAAEKMLANSAKQPARQEFEKKIESVEVKDGRLIITLKHPAD